MLGSSTRPSCAQTIRELVNDQPRAHTVPETELISTLRRPSYGVRPSTSETMYDGWIMGSGSGGRVVVIVSFVVEFVIVVFVCRAIVVFELLRMADGEPAYGNWSKLFDV